MTRDDRQDSNTEERLRRWLRHSRPEEHLHSVRSVEEGLRRSTEQRRSIFPGSMLQVLSIGGALVLVAVAVWTGVGVIGPLIGTQRDVIPMPSAVDAADRIVHQQVVPRGDVIAARALNGSLWLLTQHGTLYVLDAATGQERETQDVGGNGCGDLAAGPSSMWFRVCPPGPGLGRTEIVQVLASNRTIAGRLSFPSPVGDAPAATPEGLWVIVDPDIGELAFIDGSTMTVTRRFVLGEALEAVSAGDGAVWVALRDEDAVAEVDPQLGEMTVRVSLDNPPGTLLLADDHLWVGGRDGGSLWRIDPRTGSIGITRDLGAVAVTQIAATEAGVWVLIGAEAMRIESTTGEVSDRIRVGGHSVQAPPQFTGSTRALAPVDGTLWFVPPIGEMQLLSTR